MPPVEADDRATPDDADELLVGLRCLTVELPLPDGLTAPAARPAGRLAAPPPTFVELGEMVCGQRYEVTF